MTILKFFSLFLALFLADGVCSHPHYPKEVALSWKGRDLSDDSRLSIRHITVPYNELKQGEVAVGDEWHCGFAKLSTALPLVCGKIEIPQGEYDVRATREEEEKWSLFLQSKEGDEKKRIPLASVFETGLSIEEHLRFDLHPISEENKQEVWILLRFGPHGLKSSLSPK